MIDDFRFVSVNEDPEKERARTIFKLLAMSAKRIKAGKPMKPFEVALLRKVFPDSYRLYRELTAEQITAINIKYKDDEFYGEHIRVMLSPEGQAWLKETLALIKSYKEG